MKNFEKKTQNSEQGQDALDQWLSSENHCMLMEQFQNVQRWT